MKYQVWYFDIENWYLSIVHTVGSEFSAQKEYFTDINEAYRYLEYKIKGWPSTTYEIREVE